MMDFTTPKAAPADSILARGLLWRRQFIVTVVLLAALLATSPALAASYYVYKNATVPSATWYWSAQGPIEGGYVLGHSCGLCDIYIKTYRTYYGTYANAAGYYEVYFTHPRVGPAKSACLWGADAPAGSISIKCAYRA